MTKQVKEWVSHGYSPRQRKEQRRTSVQSTLEKKIPIASITGTLSSTNTQSRRPVPDDAGGPKFQHPRPRHTTPGQAPPTAVCSDRARDFHAQLVQNLNRLFQAADNNASTNRNVPGNRPR